MARRELTFSDSPAIEAADLKKGDVLSGIFLGTRQVAIAGRDKPGVIIELQTKDGPRGLWAPSGLQVLLSQLRTGTAYDFEYGGKLKNPKPGRPDFHSFKVFESDGEVPV